MPAIRRRYHYGNVILSHPETLPKQRALCGDTIELFCPTDNQERLNFSGFIFMDELSSGKHESFCLLHQITGLHLGEPPYFGDWIDYDFLDLVLGVRQGASVFIPIHNQQLIICGHKPVDEKPKKPNNISYLNHHR